MDKITILCLTAATAIALVLALWAMHMASDTKNRVLALEHVVFGTEPTP